MEYQKIINLLGNIPDKVPKCITEKWIEVHDQSGNADNRYKASKQIRFKTPMLQSDLGDYSDAYIVVKVTITVAYPDDSNYNKELAFENNAPFISCISKINYTLIDNAEGLDIVMPMYNLIEYSKNYSKASGCLWNYYRDERNSALSGENNNVNYSIKDSKSFDYKINITKKLSGIDTIKDVGISVPLKYLSNFWKKLDVLLVNCEVSLINKESNKRCCSCSRR